MFKLDLEKAEEPEIKLPTSAGSSRKQDSSREHLLLFYWLCQSLWLCGSQPTVENSSRDGNTRPPGLLPVKSVCRSRSNSWNQTWNDRLVSNREGVRQGCILSPCLMTYMQSTSSKILGWMEHKLESRLLGEISITLDTQMTSPL